MSRKQMAGGRGDRWSLLLPRKASKCSGDGDADDSCTESGKEAYRYVTPAKKREPSWPGEAARTRRCCRWLGIFGPAHLRQHRSWRHGRRNDQRARGLAVDEEPIKNRLKITKCSDVDLEQKAILA
jgi:hypothetical protein